MLPPATDSPAAALEAAALAVVEAVASAEDLSVEAASVAVVLHRGGEAHPQPLQKGRRVAEVRVKH
jgi:hypothetical protein